MAQISIGCYTVRITDKATKENLPLGNFASGQDLMRVFTQYLYARRADYSIDDERRKLLRVQKFHRWRNRRISGVVETGEYGYRADLYNVYRERVSYQRNQTDAELLPFYFLVAIPAQLDEGVILLQRRSNVGIRTVFLRDFTSFFEERYPSMRVSFNPLVPPQLINEYLQGGRLTKVRFIRYALPPDLADTYDNLGHIETEGTAELVWSSKRGMDLPLLSRVYDVFAGKRAVTEMVELPGYDYENVKVELQVKGRRKTLDLSNVMKMRAYVDVTDEVQLGVDGHPEFDSIDHAARDLMADLLAQLGTGS